MSEPGMLAEVAGCLGSRASRDVPLGPLTTYRVGGRAELLMRVEDEADVEALTSSVVATGIDVLVVGKGSNLLVADAGFPGLAVVLGDRFSAVAIDGIRVEAGAAAALPVVARRTVRAGLAGFEWAVGVPGSIGGAVRMNAGGHGSDMAATIEGVRVVDLRSGEDGWMPVGDLALGYRHSALGPGHLVLSAQLRLELGDPTAGAEKLAEIVAWRRANQPGGANAGSVFTNPPQDSAGRLVEVAGAKGLRLGSAAVSSKHANFIQVDQGGSADDVLALMVELQRRVLESTGVELQPETHLVGFGDHLRSQVEGSA